MLQKVKFEWDLPDSLIKAVVPDQAKINDELKQAIVLDWVRLKKISLRKGAELLDMTYRDFLTLMSNHRIPSIDYEEGWLEKELATIEKEKVEQQP